MIRRLRAPMLLSLVVALALPTAAHATWATPLTPAEGTATSASKVPITWTIGTCEGSDRCGSPSVVISTTQALDAAGRLSFEVRYANTPAENGSAETPALLPGQYWYQIQWRAFNGAPGFEGVDHQTTPVRFTVNDDLRFVKVETSSFYSSLKKWDYNVQIAGTSPKYKVTTAFAIQTKRKNGRLYWAPAGAQSKVIDHSVTSDPTYKEREYITWSYGNKFRVCKSYKVRFTTTVVAVGSPGAKPRKHATIGKLVCKPIF